MKWYYLPEICREIEFYKENYNLLDFKNVIESTELEQFWSCTIYTKRLSERISMLQPSHPAETSVISDYNDDISNFWPKF